MYSLCIVHDHSTDWETEAELMSQVYGNAQFTISASLPWTNSAGVFREFDVENDSAELVIAHQCKIPITVHVIKDWKSWDKALF